MQQLHTPYNNNYRLNVKVISNCELLRCVVQRRVSPPQCTTLQQAEQGEARAMTVCATRRSGHRHRDGTLHCFLRQSCPRNQHRPVSATTRCHRLVSRRTDQLRYTLRDACCLYLQFCVHCRLARPTQRRQTLVRGSETTIARHKIMRCRGFRECMVRQPEASRESNREPMPTTTDEMSKVLAEEVLYHFHFINMCYMLPPFTLLKASSPWSSAA